MNIDSEFIKQNPWRLSDPRLEFERHSKGKETTTKKMSGLKSNEPFDFQERDFDTINIIPVTIQSDPIVDGLNNLLNHLKEGTEDDAHVTYSGFSDLFDCNIKFPKRDQWYIADQANREVFSNIAEEIVENVDFKEGKTRNMVVFITEASRGSPKSIQEDEYVGMKKTLIEEGFMPSQCLSIDGGALLSEIKGDMNSFTLFNISCQMYSKVGGIPWSISQPDNTLSEIDVGIKACVPKDSDSNYAYGVAQIFGKGGKWADAVVAQDGSYESDSYQLSKPVMKELLESSLDKYDSAVGSGSMIEVNSMNIHKPGNFSEEEIDAVAEFGEENDIEVSMTAFRESKIRLYAGDKDNVNDISRGYVKQFSKNEMLLCSSGHYRQYRGEYQGHNLGTPKPLEVESIDESGIKKLNLKALSSHVLKLTALRYDDAVHKEISDPVTLKYAEKVGSLISKGIDVSKVNEDVPWFL